MLQQEELEERQEQEETLRKPQKKTKRILAVIGIAVLAVAVVVGAVFVYKKAYSKAAQENQAAISQKEEEIKELENKLDELDKQFKESQMVTLDSIEMKIQNIGELATVEYCYTDAGKFEDPWKIFGKKTPFTAKSFIAKWDGVIKAGVEVSEITAELDENNKKITIHIPKAKILSHEIDSDSVETLDEKSSMFNKITVEDVRAFDAECKGEMEKRAIQNGILEKAQENAKSIIQNLIYTDQVAKQGYEIIFDVEE